MDICHELHQAFNALPHHHFPYRESKIPLNGIYILFEEGETAHGTNRIVRIGTHTGADKLPSRLKEHFIKENKDRSIFRKNIGRALLNKAGDPFLEQWELDLTSRADKELNSHRVDQDKKKLVEQQVTTYMRSHFWFVVFPVPKKETRLMLESRIISTVSRCPDCRPSADWLGLYSSKDKIREGGLWIVNELYKQPFTQAGFDYFSSYLSALPQYKSS